jgi:dGTPase
VPYSPASTARRSGPSRLASVEDSRGEFARDRDRLLYSSAFRRLSGKSQVVASLELGSYHTRLTHSIKVAQLGRRIAERFQRQNEKQGSEPNADLVEFACLAHDLGHPPFGHAGEAALQVALDRRLQSPPNGSAQQIEAMEKLRQRLGSFEGNPQSHRIVTRLAHKWLPSDGEFPDQLPDWFGLDLTAASIDAVSKYPWLRGSEADRKWGCYGSRFDQVDAIALNWARTQTGAKPVLGVRAEKSFEAQIMDWSDDVTYAVHDVEDFYEAGLIPLERLMVEPGTTTEEWNGFRDSVVKKWKLRAFPTFQGKSVEAELLDTARDMLFDLMWGVPAEEPFRGTNRDRRLAHWRTSGLIQYFLAGLSFDGEPLLHEGRLTVAVDEDRSQMLVVQCEMLKELIWTYVIDSPGLASQQAGHRRIIIDLVNILSESDGYLVFPLHLRELLEDPESRVGYSDELLAKLRLVSDFVSSLTEQHAIALHKRLTGTDLGSINDQI